MTQAKPLCCGPFARAAGTVSDAQVIADLARAKAIFQLRTIMTAMGIIPPAPATLPADANLAGGGHSVPRALGGE